MQSFEAHLSEAIEAVSAWDLPDTEYAAAVNAQARLLAGVPFDEFWSVDSETPAH